MPTRTLHAPVTFIILTFLFALAACGSGKQSTICPLTTSCGCGPGVACVAPAYVYATFNGQITEFPVDPSTGGLGSATTTNGPSASLGLAALDSQFLYVSNFQQTATGASLIDAWSINLSTGTLASVPGSPFSLAPLSLAGGLAVDNAVQVLYVGDVDKIDALKADATGALTAIPGSPFPAGENVYLTVDPQDRFLFAADDTPPGNVLAFTIDSSTGALTTVPGSPFAAGSGSVTSPWLAGIVVDSSGKFVYTVLERTNQVAAFSIMAPGGGLNPVPGSPFATGNDPDALATVNNFLYVANAADGTLSGYIINPTSGVLMPLAGSPFAIRSAALTTDPGGNFLYVSGSSSMRTYKIDATSGALTQIGLDLPYEGAGAMAYVQ